VIRPSTSVSSPVTVTVVAGSTASSPSSVTTLFSVALPAVRTTAMDVDAKRRMTLRRVKAGRFYYAAFRLHR
jgi:hypothetical protein